MLSPEPDRVKGRNMRDESPERRMSPASESHRSREILESPEPERRRSRERRESPEPEMGLSRERRLSPGQERRNGDEDEAGK